MLTTFAIFSVVVLLLLHLSPWFSLFKAFFFLPSWSRVVVVVIGCFFMWWVVLRFFGICIVSNVEMVWQRCVFGLRVTIMVNPVLILNSIVSWIVDDMAWSWKTTGHPRSISSSTGRHTTENSISLVVVCFLSWLTKVSGRFMVPIGHNRCPVIPMSGPLVEGFRPSLQGLGVGGNND